MTVSEIEDKIAENEMTAAQVFTQMCQHTKTRGQLTEAARKWTIKEYGKTDLQERNLGIIYSFLVDIFD